MFVQGAWVQGSITSTAVIYILLSVCAYAYACAAGSSTNGTECGRYIIMPTVVDRCGIIVILLSIAWPAVTMRNRYNAECQIGESEHNASLHQCEDESGHYLLHDPIPFNGTITAVNAKGFCTLVNKTDQIVALRLVIYQMANNYFKFNSVEIEAECDNTTVVENNCTLGSVHQDNMDVKVHSDDRIAIKFNTTSCGDICTFQPATVNNSNSQFMYFPKGMKVNSNRKQQRRNLSLHFSANILKGKITKKTTSVMCKYGYRTDACTCYMLSLSVFTFSGNQHDCVLIQVCMHAIGMLPLTHPKASTGVKTHISYMH